MRYYNFVSSLLCQDCKCWYLYENYEEKSVNVHASRKNHIWFSTIGYVMKDKDIVIIMTERNKLVLFYFE